MSMDVQAGLEIPARILPRAVSVSEVRTKPRPKIEKNQSICLSVEPRLCPEHVALKISESGTVMGELDSPIATKPGFAKVE
jgi:hypothetical protein